MVFKEVAERLREAASFVTGEDMQYDKDIAALLGMDKNRFYSMRMRESIPYAEISKWCIKNDINLNWVIGGTGTMMVSAEPVEIRRIKHYPEIALSAGGGAVNGHSETEYIILGESAFNRLCGNRCSSDIEAVSVIGDSMEPTLQDGSLVLIDKADTNIARSGIFAVSAGDAVYVKRVVRNVAGQVDVISDNSRYPLESFSPDVVGIIGRVVGEMKTV